MRLKQLYNESLNNRSLYGYRTIPGLVNISAIAEDGLRVSRTTETYWSYQPILYTHIPGPVCGSVQSNLIECHFDIDDPGLCGFGDGGNLFQYLTHPDIPSEAIAVANMLPTSDRRKLDLLRTKIVTDQKYTKDWMFAGILPDSYKIQVIETLMPLNRHIPVLDRFCVGEFTYVGPIPIGKNGTAIVSVNIFEFSSPGMWNSRGKGAKHHVMYTNSLSQINK